MDVGEPNLNELEAMMKQIYVWLYIASLYANQSCSKEVMKIYFYLSDFKKELPMNSIENLGPLHVNSGLSDVCRASGEMVIFRKEEWLKVFIHESFHNLGLDFADMAIQNEVRILKKTFPINSEMLFFEAYTETWAEMLNIMIYSFDQTSNYDDFYDGFTQIMYFERVFSLLQCVKVLDFMGLTYNDLTSSSSEAILKRQTLFKEDSNIFCYYVLKNVLIQHYDEFLTWCQVNNLELIQFKKTPTNLKNFTKLLIELSDNPVEYEVMEKVYREKIRKNGLGKTLRMSLCEFTS